MANEGMSEDEAQALASVVRRQADHDVEVLPEDGCFVVEDAEDGSTAAAVSGD